MGARTDVAGDGVTELVHFIDANGCRRQVRKDELAQMPDDWTPEGAQAPVQRATAAPEPEAPAPNPKPAKKGRRG